VPGADRIRADAPTVKQALASQPQNSDVEIDVPDPKTYDQCKVTLVREGKATGWIVAGPAGQPLRRFMDTNGDNVVDLWCYYKNGLEVYRDIDTNFNNKKDQFRWLNFGGTRWGVDTNEDGKIDAWKQISAEKSAASPSKRSSARTPRSSPAARDQRRPEATGHQGEPRNQAADFGGRPGGQAPQSRRQLENHYCPHYLDALRRLPPATVPAESIKTADDVVVYENVMAIVDFGNPMNPGLVHVAN